MSGTITLKPASANALTWLRHSFPESGNPWMSTTGRPSPVTSYSIPTPPLSTRMFVSVLEPPRSSGGHCDQFVPARPDRGLVAPSRPELDDAFHEARTSEDGIGQLQHRDGVDEPTQDVRVLPARRPHRLADR